MMLFFLMLGLFQLSDKSLPNLHRVCPNWKISLSSLWSCPWHSSAVWCCLLMLGLFQLSHKSLPNLHRVCPRYKLSSSFYDLIFDTLVLYDLCFLMLVGSNLLTKKKKNISQTPPCLPKMEGVCIFQMLTLYLALALALAVEIGRLQH